MRFIGRAAMIVTSSLLGLPAAAQQQPPQLDESGSEIVITGERVREEQVRDFVSILTPPRGASIPRFIDQICPVTVGLSQAQNAKVTARLRQVAAAVNLNVGAPGCAPNALLIVTRDKQAFIQALARQRPHSFGTMTALQIRRLARSPGPAAAWQLSGPVDSDGVPLRYDESLGMYVNDTSQAASRIRSTSQEGFDGSAVVVESGALDGLTLTQLADYAAMRLFARLNPAKLPAPAPPTILSVLEAPMGSEVPITMTEWDVGLLRGLYATSSNLRASGQRSQISQQVIKELEKPNP
jgi:hypothetical protein